MQRIRFTIFITLLSALSAPAFGKSTTQLDNGDFLTEIDATAGGAFSTEHHDFTYFSFEDQDVVVLTDAEAAESAEWDIAFKRSEIRLNGGISGPGNVMGFDLMGADDIVAEECIRRDNLDGHSRLPTPSSPTGRPTPLASGTRTIRHRTALRFPATPTSCAPPTASSPSSSSMP